MALLVLLGRAALGWGDFLVDNTIELLFDEQVVMPVKHGGDVVSDQ